MAIDGVTRDNITPWMAENISSNSLFFALTSLTSCCLVVTRYAEAFSGRTGGCGSLVNSGVTSGSPVLGTIGQAVVR